MKRIFNFGNVFFIAILALMTSCATSHQALLGDFIGFGDDATTSFHSQKNGKGRQTAPYELYTPSDPERAEQQAFEMKFKIDNTEMENNTAGIFAMDLALDRVKYVRKHYLKRDPDAKYYIIYMTDGLDNISVQVAKNNNKGNYKTPEKYQKKMQKKIAKISRYKKKNKNQFEIYPIVFTGSDLGKAKKENNMSNDKFEQFINDNMSWLRGSSRGPEKASPIIQAENFDTVLYKFKDEFTSSGFEFHVPKGYAGKEIKMTFRGTINGNEEKLYKTELTGKFIRKGNKYYLEDVQVKNGLDISNEAKKGKIQLTATNNKNKNAELAIFRLEKPQLKGKSGKGRSYFINKDYYNPEKDIYGVEQDVNNNGMWIRNSEYISQSKGTIDTYFILVFDASKSLKGDGFAKERETALDIINIITDSAFETQAKVDELDKSKK